MLIVGTTPAQLLIIAGAVNGLILPISLGISLIASKNKKVVGEDYKHPTWLLIIGIIVVVIAAYFGIKGFDSNIVKLFA